MKFVQESTDYGAPEFCATGISSVERISRGQVRVSYFSRRKDGNTEVCHIVLDASEWRRHCEMLNRTADAVLAEQPLSGADDHQSADFTLRVAPRTHSTPPWR
jgi:hypothetical protein